jgi:hypothetical protein
LRSKVITISGPFVPLCMVVFIFQNCVNQCFMCKNL